jgi:hypothetical protein
VTGASVTEGTEEESSRTGVVARAGAPLHRIRSSVGQGFRTLLRPEGLPPEAADQIESTLGRIVSEALSGGAGRVRRVRGQIRAAPPRLLDRMSGQVIDHPLMLESKEDVEQLAARQAGSIAKAMGVLQMALVAGAAASTLEGGAFVALGIDGAVGQVASLVHGICDWYDAGSYLVRRLDEAGVAVDQMEVRRLTNAALMSRGKTIDDRALARSTELRLVRGWIARGLLDALPFGSTLGKAAPRAAERIDRSDLPALVEALRASG